MIESYLEGNPWLRGALVLVDARRSIEDEEHQLIEYLRSQGIPFQVVLTKSDKLSSTEVGAQRRRVADVLGLDADRRPIAFSTVKNRGAGELLDRVAGLITLGRPLEDFVRES
jgi:GTP-binding protein